MTAKSGAVPNLVGGISQQPPEIRPLNSAESLLNTVSDTATGLQTRPCGRYIATLPVTRSGAQTVASHEINKASGRYKVTVVNGSIGVTNVDTGATEPVTVVGAAAAYITEEDSQKHLGFVTIADTTFIFNRNKTVTKTTTAESGLNGSLVDGTTRLNPNLKATVWVKQRAGYNSNYTLYVNGTLAANVTTNSDTPGAIATTLNSGLSGDVAASSKVSETVLTITFGSETDYINSQDGFANEALFSFNDSVDQFTDLTNFDTDGRLVLIKQSLDEDEDDYWVWNKAGVWTETFGWNAYEKPDDATMPHVLFDNGDGTWELREHSWTGRDVGDSDSNPTPTFIGNTINHMWIYKGRLCVLSDENLIASQVNVFENFYRSTCTQLIDEDRIDLPVPSGRAAEVRHAKEFDNALILFSRLEQFSVVGDQQGLFSPNTVNINKVNSYNCSADVTPTYIGPNIIFADDFENSSYATVQEYQIERQFGRQIALSITDAVPELIPAGVYRIEASSSDDILFLLTSGSPQSIWLYNYYFNDQGKVQSSWQEWRFAHDVYGAAFIDDELYVTHEVEGELVLTAHTFDTGADGLIDADSILLDLRVNSADVSVAFDGTNTSVQLPYNFTSIDDYRLVVLGGTSPVGSVLRPVSGSVNTLYFKGNRTADEFLVGLTYEFRWKISPIYVRDRNLVAIQDGRLQLRGVSFLYSNSGPFDVCFTPPGRDAYISHQSGFIVGSSSDVLSSLSLDSGKFRITAHGKAEEVEIEVVARTPFRVAFSSLEWDGRHRAKRRRTT